jgi:hypothetical protein
VRTFAVEPEAFHDEFTLSPDGRSLAALAASGRQVRSPSTGALIATRTLDGWNPPLVFRGVSYESRETGDSLQSLLIPTTITPREDASGRTLHPLVVPGAVFGLVPVDPDPALARSLHRHSCVRRCRKGPKA